MAKTNRLTEITVVLVPRATVALADTARLTGDTPTDVVNRAIQVYAKLCMVAEAGGGTLTFDVRQGEPHTAIID